MNILESYLKEISSIIKKNKKKLNLIKTNNFKGVNLEIPPPNIKSDLSTNICMVLSKLNKLDPNQLSTKVKDLIKENISDFKHVEIAGPGFININLSQSALITIINNILNLDDKYFIDVKNKLIGLMYCYLIDKKIKYKFKLNLKNLFNIITIYYHYPNLLLKKIFRSS